MQLLPGNQQTATRKSMQVCNIVMQNCVHLGLMGRLYPRLSFKFMDSPCLVISQILLSYRPHPSYYPYRMGWLLLGELVIILSCKVLHLFKYFFYSHFCPIRKGFSNSTERLRWIETTTTWIVHVEGTNDLAPFNLITNIQAQSWKDPLWLAKRVCQVDTNKASLLQWCLDNLFTFM